jgi:DNA-binding ferritin-like protein
MEDLTMNADVIAQQLDIKSRQIDDLNARLALIQANPRQSVKDLQDKLDLAQEAYDKASADLSTRYMGNVISLAKTCINKNNEFSMTDFSTAAEASKIAVAAFDNIEEGMNQLTQTQLAVTQTSRALTALMAATSLAEASDTAQEIVEL